MIADSDAARDIDAFGSRWGSPHLDFAKHAAFPLAIAPDLVYRLWATFRTDITGCPLGIPWIAVADLLLSPLCSEVGHELFEMRPTIQRELLSRLQNDTRFGHQRFAELSAFVASYYADQLNSYRISAREFAEDQRWFARKIAIAYIDPARALTELVQEDSDDPRKLRVVGIAPRLPPGVVEVIARAENVNSGQLAEQLDADETGDAASRGNGMQEATSLPDQAHSLSSAATEPSAGAAIKGEPLWDENIWEELLAYIEEERVIPIIGPASSTIDAEGRQISLESYVAEHLASQLALAPDAFPSAPTLNEVVSLYLHRNGRREALYPRIRDIVRSAGLTPPKVLRQLAEIRHFNLFVTTSFDNLLERAINEVRFGGEARTESMAYAPNNVRDLKTAKHDLTRPTVYYLFGRASASPSYAISEEDQLEFLYSLQSESRRPERLFDELENNHLFFLGCSVSGWVTRQLLRMARRRRLSDPREVLEILADDGSGKDPGLVAFLGNFSSRTMIFHAGAEAFVDALWQRWHQRFGGVEGRESVQSVPPPLYMPEGAIFVSYARDDLAAVRTLKNALDAAGLTVWFDFDRLAASDTFDLRIQDNIKRCSLFLPVLSRATEARSEGFFRREWRYALDRDLDIDPSTPFIIPVAIEENLQLESLPQRFREINIARMPEGRPTPEFIEQLKRIGRRR